MYFLRRTQAGICSYRIVVLSLIEHVQPFTVGRKRRLNTGNRTADGAIISHLRLTLLSTFRSNQHNTRSRTGTVDGGRSVLQHRDVLNIIGIHGIQVIQRTGHTVNDHQRITITVDRNITTNLHRSILTTRTAGRTRNDQSRNLALQSYSSIGDTFIAESLFTFYLCDSTRQ